jgi:predicted MFS family arabinose efflux permease
LTGIREIALVTTQTQAAPRGELFGGPPWTVAAVILLGAIAGFSLGTQPAVAAQLAGEFHLTGRATALLLTVEGAAAMLTSVLVFWGTRMFSARALASAAGVLFVVANLLASRCENYEALLLSRALAGLGGGTVMIISLMSAAGCSNPERVYGGWVVGQTLASTAGLYFLPRLFSFHGIATAYFLMAMAMLLAIPLMSGFSSSRACPAANDARIQSALELSTGDGYPRVGQRSIAAACSLLALFLFYTSIAGIWAFAASRGAAAHLPAEQVTADLSAANIVSLLGALLAAWIGHSARRHRFILAGHMLLALSLLLFAIADTGPIFAASVILLQIAWAFGAPFLLSLNAAIEPGGSIMIPANFALGAGLAAGPLLTGFLLDMHSGFVLAAAASGAMIAMGLLALWSGTRVSAYLPPDIGAAS